MNLEPDFVAELYYHTTEQGGRRTPVWTGYRPQVKFPFSDMQTSGPQRFLNNDEVHPGDTVIAEITVISNEHFKRKLYLGLEFDFREASRIIGTGKVLQVINPELEAVT
jgi:translation elongation factor EF-Tu-like GTPase